MRYQEPDARFRFLQNECKLLLKSVLYPKVACRTPMQPPQRQPEPDCARLLVE